MAFISSAIATNQTSGNQDIIVATQEMQKANYFTFVMLINMAPQDTIQGGITFLMPNDRTLSKTDMSESSVVDFLLRHSIPSPLLIDHLEHFPTESMIPTSKPGFMFRVTNDGRRRFFLSNVRVISPNICTKGSNIRCHGIDGVAQPDVFPRPNIPPPPTASPTSCFNSSTSPWAAAAPSPPSSASAPPSVVEFSGPISGSPEIIGHGGVFDLVMTFFMFGVMKLLWF
ncbi:hypothetical protein PHJA_002363600 [Phtheirospermum japonicum]|uniref:FAS1 domain-containing protein n=1 Tax=Phtheirospermum japonicum TaxID=374723 RepID=A0A830CSN6_9LAMI|nr:hypothetical protein PHJA_002363600 [Phtheirospermum japonicum]